MNADAQTMGVNRLVNWVRRRPPVRDVDGVNGVVDAERAATDARLAMVMSELASMDSRDMGHPLRESVSTAFHRMYYDEALTSGGTWHRTNFLGTKVWKLPLDLWLYQEAIHTLQPDLIIECGTAFGGSALFLAHMCDAVNRGSVVSIDIAPQPDLPKHPRISYITGSSVAPDVIADVTDRASSAGTVLVILDSDHSCAHVLAECRAYADIVTTGSYLVVEDTNVNGHPVYLDHGPGPAEAVDIFLQEDARFAADPEWNKFLISFNPGGWLKKLS